MFELLGRALFAWVVGYLSLLVGFLIWAIWYVNQPWFT